MFCKRMNLQLQNPPTQYYLICLQMIQWPLMNLRTDQHNQQSAVPPKASVEGFWSTH